MNNDNQIKHHLYWIMRGLGHISPDKYAEIMDIELNEETCEEIDKLVAHIKLTY